MSLLSYLARISLMLSYVLIEGLGRYASSVTIFSFRLMELRTRHNGREDCGYFKSVGTTCDSTAIMVKVSKVTNAIM